MLVWSQLLGNGLLLLTSRCRLSGHRPSLRPRLLDPGRRCLHRGAGSEHPQRHALRLIGHAQSVQCPAPFLSPSLCDLCPAPPLGHLVLQVPHLRGELLELLSLLGVSLPVLVPGLRPGCSFCELRALPGDETTCHQGRHWHLPPIRADIGSSSYQVITASAQGAYADTCHLGGLLHAEHRCGARHDALICPGFLWLLGGHGTSLPPGHGDGVEGEGLPSSVCQALGSTEAGVPPMEGFQWQTLVSKSWSRENGPTARIFRRAVGPSPESAPPQVVVEALPDGRVYSGELGTSGAGPTILRGLDVLDASSGARPRDCLWGSFGRGVPLLFNSFKATEAGVPVEILDESKISLRIYYYRAPRLIPGEDRKRNEVLPVVCTDEHSTNLGMGHVRDQRVRNGCIVRASKHGLPFVEGTI